MRPCHQLIRRHLHHLPLRRASGWIRRVSGQWSNCPIRVHLKFTGLFLAVSGETLCSCMAALAPFRLYAISTDSTTSSCVSLLQGFAHYLTYVESWRYLTENKPVLLYIEPPPPVTRCILGIDERWLASALRQLCIR